VSKFEAARLRFGAWVRERKERAEERKAAKARALAHDPHAHSRFFLLTVPATATLLAAIVEWYWAILFCIQATGALDWNWQTSFGSAQAAASDWNFSFSAHVPVLLGLVFATAPIVMLSMVWLPAQFAMRGSGRLHRGTIIAVGLLANLLVIVSGTVVMNHNRQSQVRQELVVEQSAAQGRAAIDARLSFEQEQLRLALANSNPYLNQAANVGAEEWERSYVAQARASNDPRLPMLERALGAARAADARRANIERLTIERAQAAPEAASAARVEDNAGVGLNTFATYAEVYRPPFVALICTLIGVFGALWCIALLERINPRDILRSGWAPEDHRIEDHSDEAPLPIDPAGMRPPREIVTDAETKEELIKIRPREYWRKRGVKKGSPVKIVVEPELLPDEVGVSEDGGARIGTPREADKASVEPGKLETAAPAEHDVTPAAPPAVDTAIIAEDEQTEPPLTDDELAILAEAPVDVVNSEQEHNDANDPDQASDQEEGDDHALPAEDAGEYNIADADYEAGADEYAESGENGIANEPQDEHPPETNPARLLVAAE